MNGHPIGFDRRIRLEWLDAAAAAVAEGLSPDEVRARLAKELAGQVAGSSFNSAMGKTKTVLVHVWVLVPERLRPLRDQGLELLQDAVPHERLAVHWGMCLATYPFFYGVAETIGRLLQLQGSVSLAELTQRMRESWGDRSTLDRAAQRVMRSMVDWGVLAEAVGKGELQRPERPQLALSGRRGAWLLAAAAFGSRQNAIPISNLRRSLVLYPYEVEATVEQLEAIGGLRVVCEGVDRHVVTVCDR
jgi:hypothetical protein